jgi:hypothetical protein
MKNWPCEHNKVGPEWKKNALLESLGERTKRGSDTGIRIVSGSPPITSRTSIVEKPATGMISRVPFEDKYFAETR